LGIAQALVNYPKVLFLDEPTSALDPKGRKEIIDLIKTLSEKLTVFFSTHILSDVEKICDNVMIIDKGKKKFDGKMKDVKALYSTDSVELSIYEKEMNEEILEKLKLEDWYNGGEISKDFIIKLMVKDVKKASKRIPALIAENNLAIERLIPVELDLETVFMKVVG
jgi:ABC-2 type transport system ATP-binding protein